jgi:hypothetical protein
VLDGNTVSPNFDNGTLHRAVMASIPIGFATYFVNVCFFVVALVVTARMVDAVWQQQRPDAIVALAGITPRWREILLFSLKFLVVYGVLTAAVLLPASFLLKAVLYGEITISKIFVFVGVVVVAGCTACLLIPSAIRLLQAPEFGSVTAEDKRRGTIFAILAVAVANALGDLFQRAESAMTFTSHIESTVVPLVTALLVNAPDVLLFIALALLAKGLRSDGIQASDEAMALPLSK